MSKYTLKLTGFFSAKTTDIEIPPFWSLCKLGEDDIAMCSKFYYSEIVDFYARGCRRYKHVYTDRRIVVPFKSREYPLTVRDVNFVIMPYNVVAFYLTIEAQSRSLDDFTAIAAALREPWRYADDAPQRRLFAEIIDVFNLMNGTAITEPADLVEQGNKLKVFQIIEIGAGEMVRKDEVIELSTCDGGSLRFSEDELLYMLGTISPVRPIMPEDPYAVSPRYIEDTVANARLSVFRNWTALSLFDSFTMLAFDDTVHRDTWVDDYFGMIYLHSVFVRFFLQKLNRQFRLDPTRTEAIVEQFEEFDVKYCFKKISYNFLPTMVAEYMRRSLDIADEKEAFGKAIQAESERREKARAKKLDWILTFLSVLTILSTIWDTACMLNALVSYDSIVGSAEIGFRIVTLTMTLLIAIIVILIFRNRGK